MLATHHQTFTCGSLTFTLLSNFSPDMTFALTHDALMAGCKSGEEVAEFINEHQGSTRVWAKGDNVKKDLDRTLKLP